MTGLPLEFARIARHFRPLAGPGALALADDAAVFMPPAGRELVISADAMVAGVHFLPDDPPDLVARKLLRTNLSDLAAMGAAPLGYLLTVSTPRDQPEAWFEGFAAGLAQDQAVYGLTLLGGDTTSTPGPVSLSLTILGTVAPGHAVRRDGAQEGHEIWVSGTIGDGALGLLAATGRLADPTGFLADRYRLPQPRLGLAVPGLVGACLDISDGLVQDLGHLCRASGVAAEIMAAAVPRSDAARSAGDAHLLLSLTGGDDYELLMTVAPGNAAAFQRHAAGLGVAVSRIGAMIPGSTPALAGAGVRVIGPHGPMTIETPGWNHFAVR